MSSDMEYDFGFDIVSYLMGRNSGGGGGGGGGGTPVQRKAVNFTDYDGTVLYSYTAAAFNSLSEMPENPTHSGLTSQGWSWSLSDAKAYVASHGGLDICQKYNTSDGKTRIYVSLPDNRLSLSVRFGVNGTAVIDWGDGTSDSTLSGMNISTMQSANHTYARAGNYVIKIAVTGTIRVFGQNGSSRLLFGTSGNQAVDMIYVTLIQKIEFGSGVELGTYAIAYCRSIESVMMPDSMTASSADHMMANCNSLKSIPIRAAIRLRLSGFRRSRSRNTKRCSANFMKRLSITVRSDIKRPTMRSASWRTSGGTTTTRSTISAKICLSG